MKYEVQHSRHESEWVVEAFNPQGEEAVYAAEFSGPDAQAHATEYAAWKNSLDGQTVMASASPNACLWPTARTFLAKFRQPIHCLLNYAS
jgi:hypothetical protein